ncbi:hypothetical protein MHA_1314 [Mannheimia haemolytica PHL213]|nr:hypothetical protein MHA_1314 [Mannheimia haemolytica PHL213]
MQLILTNKSKRDNVVILITLGRQKIGLKARFIREKL